MLLMDGILIIDKPVGPTSHDVIARVRRILHERRVGHTGTLDPFATGVLVVLVGKATRLAQFLTSADKEYEAVIRMGYATDTGDITGTPRKKPSETEKPRMRGPQRGSRAGVLLACTDGEIEIALQSLCGEINQIPPMYSAKKSEGRKLYELARRGEEIERQPVKVQVYSFSPTKRGGQLLQDNANGTVDLAVRVVCSAGTYIRTLAEDFGKLLGLGAHLAELRRTRAGDFLLKDASTLEQLKQIVDEGSLETTLLAPDAALPRMPFVHLSASDAQRVRHGMAIPMEVVPAGIWADGEKVRIRDKQGNLMAIGIYDQARRLLHPHVVVAAER
jgi:tRNA pseudouridine55 synthase